MNSYIGKELNLSHCKLIVFSEEVAVNGIEKSIYSLINNVQIRPSTNLVISKFDAYSYLDNSKPALENLTSRYYEIFPSSGTYTGFTFDATIGDFFNNLVSNNTESYAILGGLNTTNNNLKNIKDINLIKSNNTTISGKRDAENIGLAVFKKDYLVGELNAEETICFSTIKNSINSFLITIKNPIKEDDFLDITIYPKKSLKAKINIINNSPLIDVSCKFEGKISSMTSNSDLLSDTNLNIISKYVNSYLEFMFYNYLYKTSTEFKSDINGFGKFALSNYKTMKEQSNFDWLNNYKNSTFKLNFETKIQSGMLLTKT